MGRPAFPERESGFPTPLFSGLAAGESRETVTGSVLRAALDEPVQPAGVLVLARQERRADDVLAVAGHLAVGQGGLVLLHADLLPLAQRPERRPRAEHPGRPRDDVRPGAPHPAAGVRVAAVV